MSPHIEEDMLHLNLLLTASISISFYCLFIFRHSKFQTANLSGIKSSIPLRSGFKINRIWFIFILSVIVCIIYYRFLVGYNLLSLALTVGEMGRNFTTLRLDSYAGENYSGAGIVNQFKNTMLPIAFFTIAIILQKRPSKLKFFLFLALATPIYLWSILGTGQRTFLFYNLVCLGLYFYNTGIRVKKVPAIIITSGVIALFSLYSVMLGRTDNVGIGTTFEQLFFRIVYANQAGTVAGFRHIATFEIQYGAEWFKVLKGLIPGVTGSDLSNQIHAILFGSRRGTVPVSLWVSIYHNFGIYAVPFVTVILLKICEMFIYFIRRLPDSEFTRMNATFLYFYIGIIPATNPFQIFNNGLFALIFIYLVYQVKMFPKKQLMHRDKLESVV
jgi:hypothetical protein